MARLVSAAPEAPQRDESVLVVQSQEARGDEVDGPEPAHMVVTRQRREPQVATT